MGCAEDPCEWSLRVSANTSATTTLLLYGLCQWYDVQLDL
jgi:hypothetical protein